MNNNEGGFGLVKREATVAETILRPCDRLTQVRGAFKLSQRGLAKRVGMTSQLISMVETGKAPLSYRLAKLIEYEFGVSAVWLLSGEGEMMVGNKNEEPDPFLSVVKCFPEITKTLNAFAKKLTVEDWCALSTICSRLNQNVDSVTKAS